MRCRRRYEGHRSRSGAPPKLRCAGDSSPAPFPGFQTAGRKGGFTLIELLAVIGIIALLVSLSSTVYVTFSRHEGLELAAVSAVEAVRHAQTNAQVGKGDSPWGVLVSERGVTVFRGPSYAGRTASDDQTVGFPGGVKASGLGEIVFAQFTGATANVGTIVLSNGLGQKNISINAKGTVSY